MQLRPNQQGVSLFYRHESREVRLFDVAPGARFAYFDETRRQWTRWPPRESGTRGADLAPAWVAIVDRHDVPLVVVALPRTAPRTREVSPFNVPGTP
jgi:hypothetical protein